MKNFTMKRVLAGVLCAAGVIVSALTTASACTTIYAGANLTQESTRFIARSEDYGSDMNKLWFVSEPGAYSGTYRGCPEYGPFTYELSHPSYRFTYFKNDNVYDGVCPECGEENAQHASYTEFGTNEKGVSVSAECRRGGCFPCRAVLEGQVLLKAGEKGKGGRKKCLRSRMFPRPLTLARSTRKPL